MDGRRRQLFYLAGLLFLAALFLLVGTSSLLHAAAVTPATVTPATVTPTPQPTFVYSTVGSCGCGGLAATASAPAAARATPSPTVLPQPQAVEPLAAGLRTDNRLGPIEQAENVGFVKKPEAGWGNPTWRHNLLLQ